MLGVTLRWTSNHSDENRNTSSCFMQQKPAAETGISSGLMGQLALQMTLPFTNFTQCIDSYLLFSRRNFCLI